MSDEDKLIRHLIATPPKYISLARANQQKESIRRVISYPLGEKKSLENDAKNAKEGNPFFKSFLKLQMECNRVVSQYKGSFGTLSPPAVKKITPNEWANGRI